MPGPVGYFPLGLRTAPTLEDRVKLLERQIQVLLAWFETENPPKKEVDNPST